MNDAPDTAVVRHAAVRYRTVALGQEQSARQAVAIQGPWTANDASHSSERREASIIRLHTDAFATFKPMSLSVPLRGRGGC